MSLLRDFRFADQKINFNANWICRIGADSVVMRPAIGLMLPPPPGPCTKAAATGKPQFA